MRSHIRYANFGILVAVVIMFGGAIIFRNAGDAAIQIVTAVAFVAALGTHHLLEELAVRRRSRDH